MFFNKNNKNIIIITGATGSGKSSFALKLAQKINGVIINADSMQIYKQIPIISAQPSEIEKTNIKHYLYGFVDIFSKNKYSVGEYLLDLKDILEKIDKKKEQKIPIIVGGTMLYISSILSGLSEIPEISDDIKNNIRIKYKNKTAEEMFDELKKVDAKYAKIVDKNNPHRILRGLEVKLSTGLSIIDFWNKKKQKSLLENYNVKKIIIDTQRDELYERINRRFDEMLKNNVLDEVKQIYNYATDKKINIQSIPKAIGLHEFFKYFDKKISMEATVDKIKQLSRNYAKRQLTWHKKYFHDFKKIKNNFDTNDIMLY